MEQLGEIESQLKRAAEERQYDAVDRLTLEYGDAARRAIAAMPSGAPQAFALARRVLDSLEQARLLVVTGRAATAQELRRIPFLTRYLPGAPVRPPALRLDV